MTQLLTEPQELELKELQLTDEQIRRLEDEAGLEYVDGRFVEKNVSFDSSRVADEISHQLNLARGNPSTVAVCGQDLAYRCHPEKPNWFRKPDVSVIRKERLREIGNAGTMPIPADLAVEVISPNDLAEDVIIKVEDYLVAGFKLVWVASPEARLVDVYHADGRTARLRADEEITAEEVLPEFRCRVGDFFE